MTEEREIIEAIPSIAERILQKYESRISPKLLKDIELRCDQIISDKFRGHPISGTTAEDAAIDECVKEAIKLLTRA